VTNQSRQTTKTSRVDYYERLTEELNKCFDDIELFVRHLKTVTNSMKKLERDQRGRNSKSICSLSINFQFFTSSLLIISFLDMTTTQKLPDDEVFIDILQKFKHAFNIIGEIKHFILNPNGPDLIHSLVSPLQFILVVLRENSPNQIQLAQEIWTPPLIRDARELLLNCLTSHECETLKNLGPAWIRTA
jgi:epidermal growth factor receptor kinase substrate 8